MSLEFPSLRVVNPSFDWKQAIAFNISKTSGLCPHDLVSVSVEREQLHRRLYSFISAEATGQQDMGFYYDFWRGPKKIGTLKATRANAGTNSKGPSPQYDVFFSQPATIMPAFTSGSTTPAQGSGVINEVILNVYNTTVSASDYNYRLLPYELLSDCDRISLNWRGTWAGTLTTYNAFLGVYSSTLK